jgi:hypothetical protein
MSRNTSNVAESKRKLKETLNFAYSDLIQKERALKIIQEKELFRQRKPGVPVQR